MPTYSMKCSCGHAYEEFRFFSEGIPPRCPKCEEPLGERFNQDWTKNRPYGWTYGEDHMTTVGQLGEHNARKMGSEQLQKYHESRLQLKSGWHGPRPEGAQHTPALDPKDVEVPWYKDSHDTLDLDKMPNVEKYIMTGES